MRIIVAMILLSVPLWTSAADVHVDEVKEKILADMEDLAGRADVDPDELMDKMQTDMEEIEELFRLFNGCASVGLVIEKMQADAAKIGLTAEDIQAAVESRLRSARIYTDDALVTFTGGWLYLSINVMKQFFDIGLSFNKKVFDPLTEVTLPAITWRIDTVGTHGMDAGFILSSLSGFVDRFLVEYLRVNEPACNS